MVNFVARRGMISRPGGTPVFCYYDNELRCSARTYPTTYPCYGFNSNLHTLEVQPKVDESRRPPFLYVEQTTSHLVLHVHGDRRQGMCERICRGRLLGWRQTPNQVDSQLRI